MIQKNVKILKILALEGYEVNYWLFIGIVVGLANEILFHTIGPPLDGVLREDFLTWPVG